MNDFQEVFPRSVCGRKWRRKLRHPGLERLGAFLAEVYQLDLAKEDRRDLIDLYERLAEQCAPLNSIREHFGIGLSSPLPDPSKFRGGFAKILLQIKAVDNGAFNIAYKLSIEPPDSIFEGDLI